MGWRKVVVVERVFGYGDGGEEEKLVAVDMVLERQR